MYSGDVYNGDVYNGDVYTVYSGDVYEYSGYLRLDLLTNVSNVIPLVQYWLQSS